MTISSRMHLRIAIVVFIIIGLAITDWMLMPAKATGWMIAIGAAIGMWFVATMLGGARSFEDKTPSERKFLMASVIAAGLIMSASLLRHMFNAIGLSGGEPLDRAIGVGAGLALLLLGNTMPKILAPLTAKRCAPATVQSLQRFAGWVFALDGLICIAASLFLPIEQGRDVSTIVTAVSLFLVLLRYVWAFILPSARSSRTSS